MRKAKTPRHRTLLDQAGGYGTAEAREHRVRSEIGGAVQNADIELPPDHGCHRQQVSVLGREWVEAEAHGVAHALGQWHGLAERAAVAELTVVAQDAQHLVEEEGVADGELMESCDEQRRRRRRRRAPDQGLDLRLAEAAQGDGLASADRVGKRPGRPTLLAVAVRR